VKKLALAVIIALSLSACSSSTSFMPFGHASQPSPEFVNPTTGETETNIWRVLDKNFSLNEYANRSEVQAQIDWYMSHQDFLVHSATRGSPYIYYIQQQVKTRNMPGELALLPIVESAYNPYAHSPSGASGLWQFLPGTASYYKVKRDWWYDGRRDIFASTQAALDYLAYLKQYFNGDWYLAIAAYNAGEGTVQNAIARNSARGLPTDFWDLRLPEQTRQYVPKLLALAIILQDQKKYPIDWPATPDKPYLAFVTVHSQIDLTEAAQLAGISMQEFYQLNPGFNRSASAPNHTYHIVVPAAQEQQFTDGIAELNNIKWQNYTVKRHDTIEKVAQRYHTTIDLIRASNQLVTDKLHTGQVLLVPTSPPPVSAHATSRNFLMHEREPGLGGTVVYRVKAGDTLSGIAERHKMSVKQLVSLNQLNPRKPLQVGEKLQVRG